MKETLEDLLVHLESTDYEASMPEWALKFPEHEIFITKRNAHVQGRILPNGEFRVVHIGVRQTLRELMDSIARDFGQTILPPHSAKPLDLLFYYDKRNELKGPIEDLSMTLWHFLAHHDPKRKFGLDLVRAIKVNSNWKVAPKEEMTPREILALYGMDPAQYTLYLPDSDKPLPLDTPLKIKRGECFEAIKDGKYGETVNE